MCEAKVIVHTHSSSWDRLDNELLVKKEWPCIVCVWETVWECERRTYQDEKNGTLQKILESTVCWWKVSREAERLLPLPFSALLSFFFCPFTEQLGLNFASASASPVLIVAHLRIPGACDAVLSSVMIVRYSLWEKLYTWDEFKCEFKDCGISSWKRRDKRDIIFKV